MGSDPVFYLFSFQKLDVEVSQFGLRFFSLIAMFIPSLKFFQWSVVNELREDSSIHKNCYPSFFASLTLIAVSIVSQTFTRAFNRSLVCCHQNYLLGALSQCSFLLTAEESKFQELLLVFGALQVFVKSIVFCGPRIRLNLPWFFERLPEEEASASS